VPATDNLPNTSVRVGDFKLYRFYYDGENQAHRYELYNLKEDIGETNNLAASMPEKVQSLDSIIEQYLVEADVLVPIKNPRFNQKPIMGWTVMADLELSAKAGVLHLMSSGQDPHLNTQALGQASGPLELRFTMRSSSTGDGQVFWISPQVKGFNKDASTLFKVQHDEVWHDYAIDLNFTGRLKNLRLDPSRGPGTMEIKNLRLVDRAGLTVHTWE
jgi:hypothetical protein